MADQDQNWGKGQPLPGNNWGHISARCGEGLWRERHFTTLIHPKCFRWAPNPSQQRVPMKASVVQPSGTALGEWINYSLA